MVYMDGPSTPSVANHVDFSDVGGLRIARVWLAGDLGRPSDLTSEEFRSAAQLGGIAAAAAAFELHRVRPIFAISVGPCVVRGVPTAARATITARVPLRRGVMEAQFGGPFAAAFARRLDLVLVYGRAEDDCVLRIDESGVHVDRYADVATSVARRASELASAHPGVHHVLTTGPAADAGIPFANLAQFDGDQLDASLRGGASLDTTPSYVGRGGLGRTVRATGVVAVTVAGVPKDSADPVPPEAEDMRAWLRRSPRLIARSVGGTLELAEERGVPAESLPSPDPSTRHGCSGCPTPCGWSFDVSTTVYPAGESTHVAARFSALQPFFESGDVVQHVAVCNAIGVDARTAARVLECVSGTQGLESPSVLLEAGSRANERALSWTCDDEYEVNAGGSQEDLASRVGSLLAARGPEPMRSLALFGPRAATPEEHGTLAYWNTCFAAAIDLSGFCAFSAAGLIADDVVSLAELAVEIAPPAGWPGAEEVGPALAMMRTGEAHAARHLRMGGGGRVISSPGGIDRASVDSDGRVDREVARAGAAYVAAMRSGVTETPPRPAPAGKRGAPTRTVPSDSEISIVVRASGPLARRIGCDTATGELSLELPGGSTVQSLLEHLAVRAPRARPWLLTPGGRAVPVVTCDGVALTDSDSLEPDSTIDLVLVVAGG